MITKICSKYGVEKDIECFSLADTKKGLRKSMCKECQAKYIEQYKERNTESVRDKWRKASRKYNTKERRRCKTLRKYNMNEDEYNRLYDLQEGKCKICGSSLTLAVDHCHETGKVRGLLCNKCNIGLGCFGDNKELLGKAINYIEESLREGLVARCGS